MASDIVRCVGTNSRGKRCKRTAVRAVKNVPYVCPTHDRSK